MLERAGIGLSTFESRFPAAFRLGSNQRGLRQRRSCRSPRLRVRVGGVLEFSRAQ